MLNLQHRMVFVVIVVDNIAWPRVSSLLLIGPLFVLATLLSFFFFCAAR